LDYNYLSVPPCDRSLEALWPIEIEVSDDLGKRTGGKRTLPITMNLPGFPLRMLLLRPIVDLILLQREELKEALTHVLLHSLQAIQAGAVGWSDVAGCVGRVLF